MSNIVQTALITGVAHRVGAAITRGLHQSGINIVLHYRSSTDVAHSMREELRKFLQI
ncbi:hypothetical protein CCP3SC5AM1_30041 [Gammaproteobacteria bacterium]